MKEIGPILESIRNHISLLLGSEAALASATSLDGIDKCATQSAKHIEAFEAGLTELATEVRKARELADLNDQRAKEWERLAQEALQQVKGARAQALEDAAKECDRMANAHQVLSQSAAALKTDAETAVTATVLARWIRELKP